MVKPITSKGILMKRFLLVTGGIAAGAVLVGASNGVKPSSERMGVATSAAAATTPAASIASFVTPVSHPQEVTAGPGGALWFTNAGNNSIGRISTRGKVTAFRHATIDEPRGITAGPDRALWFTNRGSIGRISTRGKVTAFRHATIDEPWGITVGPDGALWFTNDGSNSIGRARLPR